MNDTLRPAAFFIADDRALDFLNSIAAPSGAEIEWLSDGHDLLDWLEQAELLHADDAQAFRKKSQWAACDAVAGQTRDLREWFRQFITRHAGQPLAISALQELSPINEILAQGNLYTQIEAHDLNHLHDDGSLHWKRHRRWKSADDLLLVVAEVIGNLICSVDFSLVKKCEGPPCTLWFYDISKNHSRRWCSMSICGNRAKAALHRTKKKNSKTIQIVT